MTFNKWLCDKRRGIASFLTYAVGVSGAGVVLPNAARAADAEVYGNVPTSEVRVLEGNYPPNIKLPEINEPLRFMLYPDGSSLKGLELTHYVSPDLDNRLVVGRRPFPADTDSDDVRTVVGFLVDGQNRVKHVVVYNEESQENPAFYPVELGPDESLGADGTYKRGFWDVRNPVKFGVEANVERNDAAVLKNGDKVSFYFGENTEDSLGFYDMAGRRVGLEKKGGSYRLTREGTKDPQGIEFKVGFDKYEKEVLEGSRVGSRKLRVQDLAQSPNAFLVVREHYQTVTLPDGREVKALADSDPVAYCMITKDGNAVLWYGAGVVTGAGLMAIGNEVFDNGGDGGSSNEPGGNGGHDNPSPSYEDPNREGNSATEAGQSPGGTGGSGTGAFKWNLEDFIINGRLA